MNWIRRRLDGQRDTGTSLIEVAVAMSLMAVFMSIFTAGVIGVYRSTGKSEAVNEAQTQLNVAFLRLDKEIRYASAISAPKQVGTDWYVEFLTTNQGSDKATCTQLRLNAAQSKLEHRTWPRASGPSAATPWIPLASRVTTVPLPSGVSHAEPFVAEPAGATFMYHSLRLRLRATASDKRTASSTELDVTITALNTTRQVKQSEVDAEAATCTEGRLLP
jgi:hypothetical protein